MKKLALQFIQPFVIIAVLAALVIGSGCRTPSEAAAQYNANPLLVAIPDRVDPATVDQLAAVTLQNRGWTVTRQDPGSVTGKLNHRGWDATVTLRQKQGSVQIIVDASEPGVPMSWLKNLQKDLNHRLVRSVPIG